MVERLAPVIAVPPVQTATGERFIPGEMTGDIELEHIHRYRFAAQLVVKKTVLDIASGDGYGSAYLAQTARMGRIPASSYTRGTRRRTRGRAIPLVR